MAQTGPLIVKVPQGIEIRGRRRINTAAELEVLLDDLQNTLVALQEQDPNAVLTVLDCDLSQNKLPSEQFENLFAVFSGANVKVQRYRLFGCPSITDEVMKSLAEYFKMLGPETVPSELHLSDCSITSEGFGFLISAVEESDAFPVIHPVSKKKSPLYLRLENNYIDEAAIQEKVDAGVIRPFTKRPGQWGSRGDTDAKVDLIVPAEKQYRQKPGPPPPPEEAGPFKPVFDKWSQQPQQQQQANGKGGWQSGWQSGWQQGGWQQGGWQQQDGWGKGAQQWPAAVPARPALVTSGWQAPGKGSWQAPGKGQVIRPNVPGLAQPRPAMQGAPRPLLTPRAQTPRPFIQPQQSFAQQSFKGVGKGATPVAAAAQRAADRSRTPVARQAAPPPRPPPGKEPPLPHPWEEHWSDEYGIPYFWNSETGDSLWERPQG